LIAFTHGIHIFGTYYNDSRYPEDTYILSCYLDPIDFLLKKGIRRWGMLLKKFMISRGSRSSNHCW